MDDRRSHFAAPLMAVALFALLLVIYVSGFYLLGTTGTAGPFRLHCYPYRWLSILFIPAAYVESLVLGREVCSVHPVDESEP